MASPSLLSEANTAFALALLKKLSDEDETKNVFLSPFSISSALAMVMLGARGDTAEQMSECLNFKDLHNVHVSFEKLLSELNKGSALSIANRLYGEQSFHFLQEYLAGTEKHYEAKLKSVDFKNNFEAARLEINNWVETHTQGKIKDLLSQGMVDCMTKLVLVSAIYFKAKWSQKFKVEDTSDAQFRLNKRTTKTVKMMHQKTKFSLIYIPEVECQVLEMPYQGKELSMLIFLPLEIEDNTTGLEKLEKELTYEKFVEWTLPIKKIDVEVQVGLPRFKMEEKYDMKDVLISMGMADVFSEGNCNLSGMSSHKGIYVSKSIHQAFAEINEEGTEAGGSTAVDVQLNALYPVRPPTFFADHPFLFFIRHNPSMSILFSGRYCSPE